MSTLHPDRRFERHELASMMELAAVREEFRHWLASLSDDDDRIAELAVILSELGANAIEASPPHRPPARLHAWIDDGACTVEVVNHLSGRETEDWDLDDPLRTGGRGLMLVSAFADQVEVDAGGDTIIIRCTARLPHLQLGER